MMPPKVSNAYRKGGCMVYKNKQPVQGRKAAVDFAKIGITNDVMFGTIFKNEDNQGYRTASSEPLLS